LMLSQTNAVINKGEVTSLYCTLLVTNLMAKRSPLECACCGVLTGYECETSHLSHFLQNESLVYSTALFSQDAEYSIYSQSRHTRENRSRIALAINISLST